MVNKIVQGIAVQLNSVFGDDYKIYQNDVSQGLKKPCFFILVMHVRHSPLINKHRYQQASFDIHFFPAEGGDNQTILGIADRLLETMEYIVVEGRPVLGTDMNYQTIDNVLHFFIQYNAFVVSDTDLDGAYEVMQTLNLNREIKE